MRCACILRGLFSSGVADDACSCSAVVIQGTYDNDFAKAAPGASKGVGLDQDSMSEEDI